MANMKIEFPGDYNLGSFINYGPPLIMHCRLQHHHFSQINNGCFKLF